MFDHFNARPDEQMVSVSQNNRRIQLAQFAWTYRLHTSLRAHRHEGRRFNRTVSCRQTTVSRFRLSILGQKFECFRHWKKEIRVFGQNNNQSAKYSLRLVIFPLYSRLTASGAWQCITGMGGVFLRPATE